MRVLPASIARMLRVLGGSSSFIVQHSELMIPHSSFDSSSSLIPHPSSLIPASQTNLAAMKPSAPGARIEEQRAVFGDSCSHAIDRAAVGKHEPYRFALMAVTPMPFVAHGRKPV